MPGSDTLFPDADIAVGSGWAPTGTASCHGALADNSDSTYVRNSTGYTALVVNMDNVIPWPTDPFTITGVTIIARANRSSTPAKLLVRPQVGDVLDGNPDIFNISTPIGNYTGQIRTKQPNGKPWSKSAVDDVQVNCLTGADALHPGGPDVTIYRLQILVTWVLVPTLTVTGPTGTQVLSQPQATWDYDQEDGLPQKTFQVKVFNDSVFAAGGFSPDTSPALYDSGEVAGDDQVRKITYDLVNDDYQVWIRAAAVVNGTTFWSAWGSSDFTVLIDEPSLPILTAVADIAAGRVVLTLDGTDNLLGAQEASFETIATSYWTTSNATATRGTAQAFHGAASLELVAASAADMAITLGYYVRCLAGQIYQLSAEWRAATTLRATQLEIAFYDDTLTLISTATSPNTNDATGSWTLPSPFVPVAPAGAVWMRPTLRVKSPANAEKHYVDAIKLSALLSVFSRGGLADRNMLTRNQSSLENNTVGWHATDFSGTTITQSATQALSGSESLRLAGSGTAGASAVTDEGLDAVPVIAGQTYTAFAFVRSASTARPCRIGLWFYDADGDRIFVDRSLETNDSSSGWTVLSLTSVAPYAATTVAVVLIVGSATSFPAGGEFHYFDEISLSVDGSTVWAPGGTGVTTTIPTISYTDDLATVADEDATWLTLDRGTFIWDAYQQLVVWDTEAPPAINRRYRARILATDSGVELASDWCTTASALLSTSVYRLKNPLDPTMDMSFSDPDGVEKHPKKIRERAGVFDVLDEEFAVVITNGVSGNDGSLTITVVGDGQWQKLQALIRYPGTLLLVEPFGVQQYIRIIGDRAIDIEDTTPGPSRTIEIDYIQAPRP